MDSNPDQSSNATPEEVGVSDLLALCRTLNAAGVNYLVYGGLACLLHGHERMTRDADIFLEDTDENLTLALSTLAKWGAGYAKELTPSDLRESIVVRICDRIVLDLAVKVWGLEWANAWHHRRIITIQDVTIPFLCRADLIRSKQTYREQDHWDVQVLRSLTIPEPGYSAES